jgi:hypothetical protein
MREIKSLSYYSLNSGRFKSMVLGREGDTSSKEPVPWMPMVLPSQPGPNARFMLKKKTINPANMNVNMLIPSSYDGRNGREDKFISTRCSHVVNVFLQLQSYLLHHHPFRWLLLFHFFQRLSVQFIQWSDCTFCCRIILVVDVPSTTSTSRKKQSAWN